MSGARVKKDRKISLVFGSNKKLDRIDLMNKLANICQILHLDPKVGKLEIKVGEAKPIEISIV